MIVYYAFQKYFLNFFAWWYVVRVREVGQSLWRMWLFGFVKFRVWPMLANLFIPLYQDTSWVGHVIAFPIRLVWGGVGLVIELIFGVILLIVFAVYLVLPVIPIGGVLLWLANNL